MNTDENDKQLSEMAVVMGSIATAVIMTEKPDTLHTVHDDNMEEEDKNKIKYVLMQLYLFKNKDENIDNISNLLEDTKDSLNQHHTEQFEKFLDEII